MAKDYKFKVKKEISPSMIFGMAAAILGLISLIFLAATGATAYKTSGSTIIKTEKIMLWGLTWGSMTVHLVPGLVVAFFLTIAASLFSFGIGGFRYIGYITFLLFIASGVLLFCTVPMANSIEACKNIIGRNGSQGYINIGWGAIVMGILNIAAGVVSFLGARSE